MQTPNSAGEPASKPGAAGQPLVCLACDRAPAAQFYLRRHVGMVLSHRVYRFRGPLCAEHAAALAREALNRTLAQGWWGVVSFFLNIFTVGVDLRAVAKASRLGPPVGTPRQPPRVIELTGPPKPKPKPLFDV